MLTEEQVKKHVYDRVAVTPQKLALMKGLAIANFDQSTLTMLNVMLSKVGCSRADTIFVALPDIEAQLNNLADYFSWAISGTEAISQLVNVGAFLPLGDSREDLFAIRLMLTTVVPPYRSGYTGSIDFTELRPPSLPSTLIQSRCNNHGFLLHDPDLYLVKVLPQIPHPDIAEALKEAVRCYRAELFGAAIAMLGKASEGLWIELGKALIDALPTTEREKSAKLRANLESADVGFAKKLREVKNHFEAKQAEYSNVAKGAGVTLDDFRLACLWSEQVRDSRNTIHYGATADIESNHENLTTLLLTGAKHLKALCSLHQMAVQHRQQ